jgi:hypothetical protein
MTSNPEGERIGSWDAGRVLKALGRIGYHPVSAMLDIADNSLSAGGTKIAINVDATRDKERKGRARAIIASFSVFDNGEGMDEKGLHNALTLGSSESYYKEGTLAKFGLGLKSAAFSLGDRLEIVSRHREDIETIRKVVLDCQTIVEGGGRYFYTIEEPSDRDIYELENHCEDGPGTIVRITKIHEDSMPKASEIIDGLKNRAGIVYYYYLSGKVQGMPTLKMDINSTVDGKIDQTIGVEPLDPLFVGEAEGNLDEMDWDGISVRWITRECSIPLDLQGETFARLDITQLPHPPSVAVAKDDKKAQKECRDNYLIGAGNYGIYIYRNYRLISWADRLNGLIPRAKDLYAFRGRLLIESEADDLLNIDVTKSRIQLSEIAYDQLRPEITEAKKTSQKAWNYRTEVLKSLSKTSAQAQVNEELDRAERLSERDDRLDEEVAPPEEKQELETRRKRATRAKPAPPQEQALLEEEGERVQYVDYLDNDQLWERAHSSDGSVYVRVNQRHRFYREVILTLQRNEAVIKIISLLLFGLGKGEYDLVYKSQIDSSICEEALQEYRERVGSTLSEIVRRIDLSALFGEDD